MNTKMKKFRKVSIVNSKKVVQNLSGFIIQPPDIIKESDTEKLMVIVAADNYYSGAGMAIGEILINTYHLREGKDFFPG